MRVLVVLFLLGLVSCATNKEKKGVIDLEEIKEVYYQKWVAGVQGGGSGIDFFVTLKQPLSAEIVLEKVQFENNEASFKKLAPTSYVARISTKMNDLILDENPKKEYGNTLNNNNLKQGEANLIFTKNAKVYSVHLKNVTEKPMLAYPSMEKPKN
jgi:hypothetical protein